MPTRDPRLQSFARELRREMTKEERHLWYDFLKPHPMRFLRQKVIGGYIVDFFCPDCGLIIELDGSQHFEQEALQRDMERTAYLQARGFRVIRFTNLQVNQEFRSVCETIEAVLHGVSDYQR